MRRNLPFSFLFSGRACHPRAGSRVARSADAEAQVLGFGGVRGPSGAVRGGSGAVRGRSGAPCLIASLSHGRRRASLSVVQVSRAWARFSVPLSAVLLRGAVAAGSAKARCCLGGPLPAVGLDPRAPPGCCRAPSKPFASGGIYVRFRGPPRPLATMLCAREGPPCPRGVRGTLCAARGAVGSPAPRLPLGAGPRLVAVAGATVPCGFPAPDSHARPSGPGCALRGPRSVRHVLQAGRRLVGLSRFIDDET